MMHFLAVLIFSYPKNTKAFICLENAIDFYVAAMFGFVIVTSAGLRFENERYNWTLAIKCPLKWLAVEALTD